MKSDILRIDYINSLPQPFIATLLGGSKYPVFDIAADVGLIRIDVCGMLEILDFSEITCIQDSYGINHNPETFYSDYDCVGSAPEGDNP